MESHALAARNHFERLEMDEDGATEFLTSDSEKNWELQKFRWRAPAFAQSSTVFGGAGARTVRLRLTGAGRRLLARSSRVALTVKGVFIPASGSHVTWRDAFLLSH